MWQSKALIRETLTLRYVFTPCFIFFGIYFQIFLTHPAYEGKPKCQIIAKNFFGRNCLGREISKEVGKLPGDQKEDCSSGSMKE